MSNSPNQPLQAWTCVKCGAALPAEAGTGELVTCGYCGTPFSLPTAKTRRGGVTISGGAVTIGGDVIGGSKRVIVTSEVPARQPSGTNPTIRTMMKASQSTAMIFKFMVM